MGIYKRGDIYWISYSFQGKQYRESTGTDNKHFARDLLAKRQVEIREQRLFDVKKEAKVSFEELAQDFLRFYHERDRGSLNRAETSVKHLSTFFGGKRLAEITPEAIEAYVAIRLQQHSKLGRPTRPATVNRELAALSKMFSLAIRHKKADKNPMAAVERLREHNIRDRVLSPEEFQRLLEALPSSLHLVIIIAYYTGMRRGEILNLRWHQIDLSKGLIRLEGVDTKTQKGRLVPLNATLTALLKDVMQSPVRSATGHVFHRNGQPIKSIRGAFDRACREANLTDFHFHDLRHTAVTNMRRAGVDPLTAMKITGHKTMAVFHLTLAIFPATRYQENGSQMRALLQRYRRLSNFVMSIFPPDFT
jgi:integrase